MPFIFQRKEREGKEAGYILAWEGVDYWGEKKILGIGS